MKKMKKIFIAICISVLILLFAKFSWDEFFSNIFPWTKTDFASHQEYMELLEEHHCFGRFSFINEAPTNVAEEKYYWHRDFKEMYAAYSRVLSDEEYSGVVEKRNEFYSETWKDWDNVVMYQVQGENFHYVDESEWFKNELGFVNTVMRNSDTLQDYYFHTVVRVDAPSKFRYSGVILNASSNELIEFSIELPEEASVDYQDAWRLQEF